MIPITRTEITPGTTGWVDVDVTAYVDPGNTAGVLLEVINNSPSGCYYSKFRENGSTDEIQGIQGPNSKQWIFVGVDSDDIFECYIGSYTFIDIFIVGYVKDSEGAFFVNVTDKTPGSAEDWIDIDISGDTGGDTALCACFSVRIPEESQDYVVGFRENGSTDDRKADFNYAHAFGSVWGAFMSVDENEIVECYIESTNVKVYLSGYLKDNLNSWANAKNYATDTAGEWLDVDMSGDIPSGNDGACLHFYPTNGVAYRSGLRKNGEEYDNYYYNRMHCYPWVELDSGRVAEQKIENVALDLWLWGYTSQPAAPPPKKLTLVQMVNI